MILVVVIALNVVAVAIYGEAEFIFAAIKIITIVGLLILALVLDLGGGPKGGRLGFHTWKHPGAMREYIASGSTGRFLGFFNTLINAAFAFGGVEQVAVAAGETKNPTRNIPTAIRRVFWRLLFFYVLGSLAVGVLVPYDNDNLLYGSGLAQSPWLIAITNAGIPVLPHILNAVLVTSASSAANANLYTGSRYLYALAVQGQAPRFLLKCTKMGVPIYCKVGLQPLSAQANRCRCRCYQCNRSPNLYDSLFRWCQCFPLVLQSGDHCIPLDMDGNLFRIYSISKSPRPGKCRPRYSALQVAIPTLPGMGRCCLLYRGTDFQWICRLHARQMERERFCFGIHWSSVRCLPRPHEWPDWLTVHRIFALLYCGWKVVKKTKIVRIHEIDLLTGQVQETVIVGPAEQNSTVRRMLQKVWDRVF